MGTSPQIIASLIPIVLEQLKKTQQYMDYIDSATAVVTTPYDNPFGDSVWRSSWFYASLLILRAKNSDIYKQVLDRHSLTTDLPEKYLKCFSQQGIGGNGWHVIGNPAQSFSRDQLAPLLLLLECVSAFGTAGERAPATEILKSLLSLEENGIPLSNDHAGDIHRNLGFIIDVLCDNARYGMVYRTPDLKFQLVITLGDLKKAQVNRRSLYKTAFYVALAAESASALLSVSGSAEASFFNSIALVTLLALAFGPTDPDVHKLRADFSSLAGAGPAFRIIAGVSVADKEIESYHKATNCRDSDNDIIMSQRLSSFLKGDYPNPRCKGTGKNAIRHLTLDYVILWALQSVWKS